MRQPQPLCVRFFWPQLLLFRQSWMGLLWMITMITMMMVFTTEFPVVHGFTTISFSVAGTAFARERQQQQQQQYLFGEKQCRFLTSTFANTATTTTTITTTTTQQSQRQQTTLSKLGMARDDHDEDQFHDDDDDDDTLDMETEQDTPSTTTTMLIQVLGMVSQPIVWVSLYSVATTGGGLPAGPFGLLGAVEGIAYLVVVGLAASSLFWKQPEWKTTTSSNEEEKKISSSSSKSKSKLTRLVEDMSVGTLVVGIVTLITLLMNQGCVPNAKPLLDYSSYVPVCQPNE
jgi:hypothetical protein